MGPQVALQGTIISISKNTKVLLKYGNMVPCKKDTHHYIGMRVWVVEHNGKYTIKTCEDNIQQPTEKKEHVSLTIPYEDLFYIDFIEE